MILFKKLYQKSIKILKAKEVVNNLVDIDVING